MIPKCASNSRRALPWTLSGYSRIQRNRNRIIDCKAAVGQFSSADLSAAAAVVGGNDTADDDMVVRVPTNSYPIERIMKAWSEKESDEEQNSFSNILAWTKTFQETSLSSSSSTDKRCLVASVEAQDEESRSASSSNSSDASVILSMLESPSLLLPKDTLIFLLQNVAQHSQNIRKTTNEEKGGKNVLLKQLQHVSSAILWRLVLMDSTADAEEAGITIGAWNAWIQCFVDDDPNEYPFDGQNGMPASTMAQNVFHLIAGNISFFNDIIEEEKKVSSFNVDAAVTDVRKSPKHQLYHLLLKNFMQDDRRSNTRLLQPDIETFNAVMDHISRSQAHESKQWSSAKQLFQWIEEHPTLTFQSHIQILRTFQILFQSMPRHTTLKTKKKFLRNLSSMIDSFNAKSTAGSAGESPLNLPLDNPHNWIQLFNACMKYCDFGRSHDDTISALDARKLSVLPPNPTYPWEHPWKKSWITSPVTAKNREKKKWMDDAQLTEDWVNFMIHNHLCFSQASQKYSTAESNGALHEEEDSERMEGLFHIPPPDVTSYACVIQGWVRTGTLFGLLRAQEWFMKLCRDHVRNIEANKRGGQQEQPTNWCKPSISTIFPILNGWAWADFDQYEFTGEEIKDHASIKNDKMMSNGASESDQNSSLNMDTQAMIIPIIVEDWIFQLAGNSNGDSKSEELSFSLDYPDILLLTTPIIAWRNFIRKHYHTRHLCSSSLIKGDVLWAAKRCMEWMHTIESIAEKRGKAGHNFNALIDYTIRRSAYTYTIDAIAFMILHSSGEESEVEDEGIQHLFEVLDLSNTNLSNDASSMPQSAYLPLLYGQCTRHFRLILRKLQKTRNDVDYINVIEHEFLCRIEKMLHIVPCENGGRKGVTPFKKAMRRYRYTTEVAFLEDILLQPTWTSGRLNDYRRDNVPIVPGPLANAHHYLYGEIIKYLKHSGCAQNPRQQGHAIRILISIVDRLTVGASAVRTTPRKNQSIDEYPVDSSAILFQEIISCIGMVVAHRSERAEILVRVYRQILSLSSATSVNIDQESLQNAVIKAMGGNHYDTDYLLKKLRRLKGFNESEQQNLV
jgi:hypothetical protein